MKSLYDISAPAKRNLCLHVTGRRSDGYHLLQSLVVFTDFGDGIRAAPREDGAIALTLAAFLALWIAVAVFAQRRTA